MDLRPTIYTAARAFSPNWRWDSRQQTGWARRGFNLWYVVRGSGRLEVAGESYALGGGDCFILRSREEHLGSSGLESPVMVYFCCYDYFDAAGNRHDTPASSLPPRHRQMADPVFFSTLMDRLTAAYAQNPENPLALTWLAAALDEVARQDRRQTPLSGIELAQARMVDEICQSIREKPGKTHRVSAMARQASMSMDHFIRVFRRHAGVTPREFVIESRITAARGLLQLSSLGISQIASQLGYVDVYAFSKQFKARTGQPPSSFRSPPTPA